MGEEPDRLTEARDAGDGPEARDAGDGPVARTAREIAALRGDLGDLVGELDRRRHEALDVRLQIRRHPLLAASVVGVLALAAGGLVAVVVAGRRRRSRPVERARALRRALGRMARHPEEFHRKPGVAERLAVSALTVAATTLARRVIEQRVAPRRR